MPFEILQLYSDQNHVKGNGTNMVRLNLRGLLRMTGDGGIEGLLNEKCMHR